MGNQQNKEEVVVNQSKVETQTKIMRYEIILIVICVLMSLIIGYVLRRQCKRKIRKWLHREVSVVAANPVVRMETAQSKTQQPRVVVT